MVPANHQHLRHLSNRKELQALLHRGASVSHPYANLIEDSAKIILV
jgi:hypothetical protein